MTLCRQLSFRQDGKTNDEKYLLKLWSYWNFVCIVLNIFLCSWCLIPWIVTSRSLIMIAEQSTRGWRLSSNLHSSTWITFLLSWTPIVDKILSPLQKPSKNPHTIRATAWAKLGEWQRAGKSSPLRPSPGRCYIAMLPFSIIWHLKLLNSTATAIKLLCLPIGGMMLLWESQNECCNWVQVYPTPKLAEDDMRPRTIAFFIKQLSWQVLALAGQETSNHIVQSLIELLPQVPGLNLYKESWLSNPSFRKKKNLLTVYHETFWVGVKRGPVSLPTSKRRFDTISTSWSRLLAALPGEFDEVTQQVCPFVEGSLHLYYHVGSQHSWGMTGSVISRLLQRYVNIGPQDMTHFYQHLIYIQFCFRCHVVISIHWHFLNFLTDSNCTSQNVGIKLHQNWSPPSHSMIPHQVHRRPKDDHPQVWPIAPAIEVSEFWSFNFFSPHSRWINLEIDIQNLHHPNPSKTSSNDDERGSCEVWIRAALCWWSHHQLYISPRFWFCFEMQPSLQ